MAMKAPRWWSAGPRLHMPRTVRMRLTLVCGSVILLSGGALVAIAFTIGGRQLPGYVVGNFYLGPIASGGRLTVASGGRFPGVVSVHGFTARIDQITHSAARFGSSHAVSTLLVWSMLGLVIVTALGLALGWALSGRMLRPLRQIRDTTQRISEANLHERLALGGPPGDELRDLGDTIDGLLGRLETAFEAQRRFVQNAAHELRTPITMMRTSLDVATGKPVGVTAEVTALADKLNEGLDQAERLLEGFLALARAQAAGVGDRAPVSLPDVVASALHNRAALAAGFACRSRASSPMRQHWEARLWSHRSS